MQQSRGRTAPEKPRRSRTGNGRVDLFVSGCIGKTLSKFKAELRLRRARQRRLRLRYNLRMRQLKRVRVAKRLTAIAKKRNRISLSRSDFEPQLSAVARGGFNINRESVKVPNSSHSYANILLSRGEFSFLTVAEPPLLDTEIRQGRRPSGHRLV